VIFITGLDFNAQISRNGTASFLLWLELAISTHTYLVLDAQLPKRQEIQFVKVPSMKGFSFLVKYAQVK
jgi:hypothetical protein